MRELWADHNLWSRVTLMGVFESMKGCEFYEERLKQNVKEVQALLVPYYGEGAVKFGVLFERHLEIEEEILYSIKSGDMTFRSVIPDWYENAEEISELLHSLNPKIWSREQMSQMWRMHVDASLEQVLAYERADWQNEILAFDFIQDHSMKMADYLSDGVAKQFSRN